MDITHRFKAGVMAMKMHRKGGEQDKQRILPTVKKSSASTPRDEFSKQAKDACQKITTLRNVLLENRAAYMRIGQHLKSAVHMTDEERDVIDRESEKFVTYYTQHLAQMRADWKRAKRKPQQHAHMEAVMELLQDYLHSVQQIYSEQKKYRIQHELETYRLLKLAADKKKIPVRPGGEYTMKQRRSSVSTNSSSEDDEHGWSDFSDTELNENWQTDVPNNATSGASNVKSSRRRQQESAKDGGSDDNNGDKFNVSVSSDTKSHSSQKVALDEDIQKSQQLVAEEEAANAAGSALNPEDVQMFEQENVQLYHELQGLSEEVELIEKNVVDIAQLQDIFTEKVSMQQHNIERIANAVIGATENVKDANEQIKQAIQRNAGLRVWSLFFLLVMSFALLFLDWYYD